MADAAVLAEMLGSTQLFSTLDPAARLAIAQQMRPANFSNGEMIFSLGDPGTEIYLVLEGRVRISVLSMEGRELSFEHFERGTIFGEIAALDGGGRTADATAITQLQTMTLSQAVLRRTMETTPSLALAALKLACSYLRRADEQLVAIALHSLEIRLARYFLEQLKRNPAAGNQRTPRFDMVISQTELALRLGASRPKVNLAISSLERQGAITRQDGHIDCNVTLLEEIAS
jgi:CRP/FNR family cyclic AMP-dependent transcriptional regulator